MKELKLHSPLGAKPISYTWPLTSNCENVKSKKNTVPAIIQTMQWVCNDYPEIQFALQNNILADYDINSYESMEKVCNRFNKMIETLINLEKGTSLPQKRIKTQASRDLLRHIMQQVYIRAVDDPRKLNDYEPFSHEVYGETSYDYICQIIDYIQATPQDVFIDLGSGVGQVVLQMAASTPCKLCIGIECAKIPNVFALKMDKYFQEWMAWFGKKYSNYELIQGDFLQKNLQTKIKHCSIFFTNNILFGPYINYRLKEHFSLAKDGTKIVSSRNFCQRNFRISNRNQNDIGRIMSVVQLPALPDSVSWTGKPFSFYLHVIDRTKQHECYNQMSMSTINEKSKNKGPTEKRKTYKSRSVPAKEKEEYYPELHLNSRTTSVKNIVRPRSVPPKENEEYYPELHLNSRSTAVKNNDRPKSVPPKENDEFYPELMQNSQKTFLKQMIVRPRSVPPKEKKEYPGLNKNLRKTLVKQKIDRPTSVPVTEKEEYSGLNQNSRRPLVKQKIVKPRSVKEKKIDRPASVPVKEKEDYQVLVQQSGKNLAKKKIGRPRSVPAKDKKENHAKLLRKSQNILFKPMIGRSKSAPATERKKNRPKLMQNPRRTSAKEKQEFHPQLMKNLRSIRFALAKEKQEHALNAPEEVGSSEIDNSVCNRPLKTKATDETHRSILKTSLNKLETSTRNLNEYPKKVDKFLETAKDKITKPNRQLITITSDVNPRSLLKTSLNKLETSTRNLNEFPKKVDKFLETAKDKITKPLSPIYEKYYSENTDQEFNKLQEVKSLDGSDISVSGLICSETLQNTGTPLLNKTLKLNNSESVISVDNFSNNNKNVNSKTNIVRPNGPTPLSKYQRRLQRESSLSKKLALLQKQVNSRKTHSMMLRKKTVNQSKAAVVRFHNYLRNKIKQYATIISKNNQNYLKLSHTNNSKIIERITTKTKYPEIFPCIEKNSRNIYPTKIVRSGTSTIIVRPAIPSEMVLSTNLKEKILPETYKEIIRPKLYTGSATEIVHPETFTRMVSTEMVRPEIPSGMVPSTKLKEKILPETYKEIIRRKLYTGSATEIVRPGTPTRMVPTEMVRPEIPSGMVFSTELKEKILPETYKEIIRPKLYTGSATEIVRPETPTRMIPTEMVHPEIPSGMVLSTKTKLQEEISTETHNEKSIGNATETIHSETSTKIVPPEMVHPEIPSGSGHTKTILLEADSKIIHPILSTGIASKVTYSDISTTMVPTEMERPEIPSRMVRTEKHPEMVHPELSTSNISTGIPSITNFAEELNNYCKQFQKMVECDTIDNDKIVAFQNAINEAIEKYLQQDIEKNKTLQTVKINYAKRMKERDMRNYLKRKLFRNQIKKLASKRVLQRILLFKIKNNSQDKIPQRKIYEDNDDNISVSSVASPEYTPFVKEDVDLFFKHFLESNERETL